MTAPAAADVLVAVTRADRAWCRQRADDALDQERREHLAAAVRELLGDTTPAAQTAEVDQLHAELADAARERERAHHQAVTAVGNLRRQLDQAAERTAELETQGREQRLEIERLRLQLGAATREHRHAWEWQPGLTWLPLPCACGKPWPTDRPPDLATVVPLRKPKGSTR